MESIKTVHKNGIQEYFNENGEYHREDGPAYESPSGHKEWCIDGKYHREDGPARIWSNGDEWYYLNGKVHREDGPARIWANGVVEYWLNNKQYSKKDWEIEVAKLKLERILDL